MENDIQIDNELKFILRRNASSWESSVYIINSPIQVIKVFNTFQEAKEEFYKQILQISKDYNGNGELIEGMSERDIYKRLMFRNIYKNKKSLDNLIGSHKNAGFCFDYNNFWTAIGSFEENEYFNLLNPLNIFEILVTINDYLYAPIYNEEFIRKSNGLFNPMTYTIDGLSIAGLYIDELDFWTSQDCSDCVGFKSFFNGIDITNTEIIDINDEIWNDQYKYCVKNGKITLNNPSAFSIFEFNKNLKIPFVIFKKIDIKKTRDYEKNIYKYRVINLLMSECHLEDESHFDELVNDNSNIGHLSFLTSLTPNFIKEVILENKEEIIKRMTN